MTAHLPSNLLIFFQPRPKLKHLEPVDHPLELRRTPKVDGVASYLNILRESKESDSREFPETHQQRQDRLKREKKEKHEQQIAQGIAEYNPKDDSNARGSAYKTLFVSRLHWDVEQKELEDVFSRYGRIERTRIVKNKGNRDESKKKKTQGYAFIVYEREESMRTAFKDADGVKIHGRPVKVDFERGRTEPNWKPMRLGGGLGGRGYTKAAPKSSSTFGGLPMAPGGFRGGGFRGGRFDGPPRGSGGGGGGFRGGPRGGFGSRGGIGYQGGGFPAPEGAPAGPRGRPGGGFGSGGGRDDRPNGYGAGRPEPSWGSGADTGRTNGHGGPRMKQEDRDVSMSGSNAEPVRPRDRYGDRDHDRNRDRDRYSSRDDYHSRKRRHEDNYDDSRDPRKRRH